MSSNEKERQKPGAKQPGEAKPGGQAQQPGARSGERQQHAASGAGQQYGEGNYQATRDYNAGVKDHLLHHDVEREAREAAPRSADEAKEMDDAEKLGKSRAGGMNDDADTMKDTPRKSKKK